LRRAVGVGVQRHVRQRAAVVLEPRAQRVDGRVAADENNLEVGWEEERWWDDAAGRHVGVVGGVVGADGRTRGCSSSTSAHTDPTVARRAQNRLGLATMSQRGATAKASSDRKEYNEAQELDNLSRVFARLNKKSDGKIDVDELWTHLKFLGYKCKRAECEDMIWEVDEDCDRCVNWEEFKTMFYRVRHDKSGWEPRRLFNVVEFMMHDKDMSGTIDMDECMEILFRRFGKEQLEAKVAEFMQNDEDGDNDISFTEFLEMDHREHYKNRGPGEGGALKASKSSTQVR